MNQSDNEEFKKLAEAVREALKESSQDLADTALMSLAGGVGFGTVMIKRLPENQELASIVFVLSAPMSVKDLHTAKDFCVGFMQDVTGGTKRELRLITDALPPKPEDQ